MGETDFTFRGKPLPDGSVRVVILDAVVGESGEHLGEGEVHTVSAKFARQLIYYGRARRFTPRAPKQDAPPAPVTRDPEPQHHDPAPVHRDPPAPAKRKGKRP